LRKPDNSGNTLIRSCGFLCIIERPFLSFGYGLRDDIFLIHELIFTSIPVSRKKILTITHPSAPWLEQLERARLFKRRPMRAGQILLSQPVVTSHNSFSGFPPQ